jgi:TonB family protein
MNANLSTFQLSRTDPGQRQTESEPKWDVTELANPFATAELGTTPVGIGTDPVRIDHVGEFVSEVLEEARLATGATGAAIALALGAKMVCLATTGPDVPDLSADLNASTGLTGCCIQTRQVQQCSDTETDPRVDVEKCRFLGVRSVVALPLMNSGDLFGVVEIFSSRANAFGESDLLSLQVLADRILESRKHGWRAPTTAPSKDCILDSAQPALVARKILASVKHDSRSPRRDYRTASLVAALVALSVLLGWMMGRAGRDSAVNQANSEISTSSEQVSESSAGSPQISVESEYPKQQQIQDPVVMNVLIGTDGSVREFKLISGDPQLMQAVSGALRRWRFNPQRHNDQPVEFETRITVTFSPL